MKNKIFFTLFFLLLVIGLSGCRATKQKTVEVNSSENDSVSRSGSGIVLDRDALPTSRTLPQRSIREQVSNLQDAKSFITNGAGDYKRISYIDTKTWIPSVNREFGFSILIPASYFMFEDIQGEFFVTAEGVGDFYRLLVSEDKPSISEGRLLRSKEVSLNGYPFTLEEYETDKSYSIISYIGRVGSYYYRFIYIYTQGSDDDLDMFTKSIETFEAI